MHSSYKRDKTEAQLAKILKGLSVNEIVSLFEEQGFSSRYSRYFKLFYNCPDIPLLKKLVKYAPGIPTKEFRISLKVHCSKINDSKAKYQLFFISLKNNSLNGLPFAKFIDLTMQYPLKFIYIYGTKFSRSHFLTRKPIEELNILGNDFVYDSYDDKEYKEQDYFSTFYEYPEFLNQIELSSKNPDTLIDPTTYAIIDEISSITFENFYNLCLIRFKLDSTKIFLKNVDRIYIERCDFRNIDLNKFCCDGVKDLEIEEGKIGAFFSCYYYNKQVDLTDLPILSLKVSRVEDITNVKFPKSLVTIAFERVKKIKNCDMNYLKKITFEQVEEVSDCSFNDVEDLELIKNDSVSLNHLRLNNLKKLKIIGSKNLRFAKSSPELKTLEILFSDDKHGLVWQELKNYNKLEYLIIVNLKFNISNIQFTSSLKYLNIEIRNNVYMKDCSFNGLISLSIIRRRLYCEDIRNQVKNLKHLEIGTFENIEAPLLRKIHLENLCFEDLPLTNYKNLTEIIIKSSIIDNLELKNLKKLNSIVIIDTLTKNSVECDNSLSQVKTARFLRTNISNFLNFDQSSGVRKREDEHFSFDCSSTNSDVSSFVKETREENHSKSIRETSSKQNDISSDAELFKEPMALSRYLFSSENAEIPLLEDDHSEDEDEDPEDDNSYKEYNINQSLIQNVNPSNYMEAGELDKQLDLICKQNKEPATKKYENEGLDATFDNLLETVGFDPTETGIFNDLNFKGISAPGDDFLFGPGFSKGTQKQQQQKEDNFTGIFIDEEILQLFEEQEKEEVRKLLTPEDILKEFLSAEYVDEHFAFKEADDTLILNSRPSLSDKQSELQELNDSSVISIPKDFDTFGNNVAGHGLKRKYPTESVDQRGHGKKLSNNESFQKSCVTFLPPQAKTAETSETDPFSPISELIKKSEFDLSLFDEFTYLNDDITKQRLCDSIEDYEKYIENLINPDSNLYNDGNPQTEAKETDYIDN